MTGNVYYLSRTYMHDLKDIKFNLIYQHIMEMPSHQLSSMFMALCPAYVNLLSVTLLSEATGIDRFHQSRYLLR
jgi:hypothetical protein